MISDTWKKIPGYGGIYEINLAGEVRVARDATSHPYERLRPGDHISECVCGGYRRLNLKLGKKQFRSVQVHRLIAETFMGPVPFEGAQVNHINGVKLDNRLENLEWVTKLENIDHAWRTGLRKAPEHRKLTADQVSEIRERLARGGETLKQIAEDYPVSHYSIWNIKHRKNWRD